MATDPFANITLAGPQPVTTEAPVEEETKKDPFANITEAIDQPSVLDVAAYGWDSSETISENLAILMQSIMPIGELRIDPIEPTEDNPFQIFEISTRSVDEMYGVPFSQMSKDERVAFLRDKRKAELERDYADVIASGESESALATTFNVLGSVADPTSVVPLGQGYKSMAVGAGLLGAEWDVLSQLVNKPVEEYDPTQTAVTGAVSAVAAPALTYLVKGAGKTISQMNKARKTKAQAKNVAKADAAMDEIHTVAARGIVAKVPEEDMPKYIQEQTGLTEDDFLNIVTQSSKPFKLPTPKEARDIMKIEAYQQDPIASRLNIPAIDNWLGVMHTNLKKISPKLANRLRQFEGEAHIEAAKGLEIMEPFAQGFKNLPKNAKSQASLHMFNGDFDSARAIFAQYDPNLSAAFDAVDTYLKASYQKLKGVGYNVTQIPNYFPRVVKDLKALQAKLSGKQLSDVQKIFKQRTKQLGRPLSENEKRLIISETIQGRKISFPDNKTIIISPGASPSSAPSATKKRVLGTLTERVLDDYQDPITALHNYVKTTSHDIAKRRFFGTGRSNKTAVDLDLENSIDTLVAQELASGRLNIDQQDKAIRLLKARFGEGEKSPAGVLQDIRNIGYMTTIGDPISTLTQIGDIGLAAYYNGLGNTIKALLGKKQIDIKELGIDDVIAQEFLSSRNISGRMLDTILGLTQFKRIDKLGKNTLINGALNKAQAMSKSNKGIEQLRKKYGDTFGKEFNNFVNDLRAGNISDNVKMFVFGELSNVQPITLSEMPVKYLESPNGRIFYQLKSYMIKQLDLIRNDIAGQYAKGNKKEAVKNALAYLAIVPSTGATVDEIKDMFLDRGFNIDEIPDNYVENLFKYFMASEYTFNTLSETGLGDVALDTFLGGYGVLADNMNAVSKDLQALSDGTLNEDNSKILARTPLIGRAWYNFVGGGLEKFEAKKLEERYGSEERKERYGTSPRLQQRYGLQ